MSGYLQAESYFRAGKLGEAIQALNEEVRESPLDPKVRTFLFELLCFAGDYDRAEKQLDVLAQGGQQAQLGAMVYRSALHAEKARLQFFRNREYQNQPTPVPPAGRLDGSPFQHISDSDPRIGARLEVFLGAAYVWIPFEHITSITIAPPKRLRDLIWTPALIHTAESFRGHDIGEVLVPTLSPDTWRHSDDQVRLGRATVWEQQDDGEIPFGQKILLVDGVEVPILELRNVELAVATAA